MQIGTLRVTGVRLGSALALVAGLAAGCNDSSDPIDLRNVNVTIPLNAAAAASGMTTLLNSQTFTGLSGSVLGSNTVPATTSMQGQSITLSFSNVSGANGNFSLVAPSFTASGTVKFASCTFTVTTSSNTTALPIGSVITISNCSVTYVATGVPVGRLVGTSGTVTLNISGVASTPLNTTVEIEDDGTLVVTTGTGTTVVTTVLITGSSGG